MVQAGEAAAEEEAAEGVEGGVETVSQTQCCGGVKSSLCSVL